MNAWHTMHTHPADAIRHVIVTAAVVHDGPVVAITNHNSTDSHMKISRIPQRCAGILIGPCTMRVLQINCVIDLCWTSASLHEGTLKAGRTLRLLQVAHGHSDRAFFS
jgi:hypothetical protein